ncbi:MAG: YbjN domain-containing protein [Ignavibacteriales bacterium]|nr:YbjN domain-containing protein [Ignavibacteriales bacterium]MCF8315038.1 YbjN domain-containing protein [Ignavibacteriales bacterium]MCF8435966.1 YbjN domain-containing protein [Ignavibacteriales bacterium]
MYESEQVLAARRRIKAFLDVKEWPYDIEDNGEFRLYQGSTFVSAEVKQWGQFTLVIIRAPISLGIKTMNEKVYRYMLEKNYSLIVGKLAYSRTQNAIYYENAILGDDLDPEELYGALESAALTADNYDDPISALTGGRRAID